MVLFPSAPIYGKGKKGGPLRGGGGGGGPFEGLPPSFPQKEQEGGGKVPGKKGGEKRPANPEQTFRFFSFLSKSRRKGREKGGGGGREAEGLHSRGDEVLFLLLRGKGGEKKEFRGKRREGKGKERREA